MLHFPTPQEYNDSTTEETPVSVSAAPTPPPPPTVVPAIPAPPPAPARLEVAPIALEASRRLIANVGVWDETNPVATVPPEAWREMARADPPLASAAAAAADAASAAAIRRAAGRDSVVAPGVDAEALARIVQLLLAKRVLTVAGEA